MSTPEQPPVEARSSVKIVTAAKGEMRYEVKVYVWESDDGLRLAIDQAVAAYHMLQDRIEGSRS